MPLINKPFRDSTGTRGGQKVDIISAEISLLEEKKKKNLEINKVIRFSRSRKGITLSIPGLKKSLLVTRINAEHLARWILR